MKLAATDRSARENCPRVAIANGTSSMHEDFIEFLVADNYASVDEAVRTAPGKRRDGLKRNAIGEKSSSSSFATNYAAAAAVRVRLSKVR